MKLITDHLGQIIAVIAAISLLITSIVFFKGPVGFFFENIIEKETSIGDKVFENLENVGMFDGEGGSGSGGSENEGSGGSETPAPDPALNPSGKIPAGAIYTCANGTVLKGDNGDEFPATTKTGDTYTYGDYEYKYNYSYSGYDWNESEEQNGWGFHAIDLTKTSYGEILHTINGTPIVSAASAFSDCMSMEESPLIPETVKNMEATYYYCEGMTKVPEIPASVTNMDYAFLGSGIIDAGDMVIPSGVTSLSSTFSECLSLEKAPVIPAQIKNLNGTFQDTPAFAYPVIIHANPDNYGSCFNLFTKYIASLAGDLTLGGTSDMLEEIAQTRNKTNVYDTNGNLLKSQYK